MLIVMHHNAPEAEVSKVCQIIESMGYKPLVMPGAERTAIGVVGNQGYVDDTQLKDLPGILQIIHVTKPYKLVSRDFQPHDTVVELPGGVKIGGNNPLVMMAGPCAVEGREQIFETARFVKSLGIPILRAGAYKPRTSPHSFQGMREEGLRILDEVRQEVGIRTVTEIMSPEHASLVASHVDMLQVGARNMQNFDLLKEVGKLRKPVLLKRGLSATVEEWLASAEYIMLEGNRDVILCERGIRTFETATRNTGDLAVIPLVKSISHLPVIFDPSHATGQRKLVAPMSLAALVAGAHGLMVETHPRPELAVSDGAQSLRFPELEALMVKLKALEGFVRTSL